MAEQVTNRQMFFIIVITLSGFSVIELPKIMAQSAGTGSWITLMIGAIIFSSLAAVIAYLGNLFQGQTIFEYSQLLVGKIGTYFICTIYLIYFMIILAFLNRYVAEVIKTELLIKTPIWCTMLLLLLFSGYAASKGFTNVGRILEYYGVIILFVTIGMHILMFINGNLMNIQPFYDSAEAIKYMTALPEAIFLFLGYEVLTIIPFSKNNGKKSIIYVIASILTVGLLYTLIVETSFMILSVEDSINYKNSVIAAMRRVEIKQLQFLVRLDIIYFMAWFFAIFSTLTVLISTALGFLNKLLPSKGSLVMVLLVAYAVGVLTPSIDVATQILAVATKYFGLLPACVIPLILLIIAKVKKYA